MFYMSSFIIKHLTPNYIKSTKLEEKHIPSNIYYIVKQISLMKTGQIS